MLYLRLLWRLRALLAGLLFVNWGLFAWLVIVMYARGESRPDTTRDLVAPINMHGILYVTPGQSELFTRLSISLAALTVAILLVVALVQYLDRRERP